MAESCVTCGLAYAHCPGHFGHIDLPMPVYNPLVFDILVKLLGMCCPHCFHLRTKSVIVEKFRRRLALLNAGKITEAMEVDLSDDGGKEPDDDGDIDERAIMRSRSQSASQDENGNENGDEERAQDEEPSSSSSSCGHGDSQTSHVHLLYQQTVRALLSKKESKCQNCGAECPTIRAERGNKVFRTTMAKKKQLANRAKGIHFPNLLSMDFDDTADNNNNDKEKEQTGKEDRGATGAIDNIMSKPLSREDGADGVPDEVDDWEMAAEAEKHEDAKSEYISPIEARRMMVLLWKNEDACLNLMFNSIINEEGRTGSPDIFFLHALAVPPNRMRPLNKIKDDTYEHPQTTQFVRVLNCCLSLSSLRSTALEEGKGFDPAKAARVCLELQNNVNGLIDSDKVVGEAPSSGVRQMIEKKEGLLRNNMMGKRVNYAARSVISPDPFIATSEIGIPPYVATKLTFPEPVTAFNLQQMRQAVENGADEHPGATHIESADGRRYELGRIPQNKRSALAKRLLSKAPSADDGQNVMKVHRHIRNGDVVLVNRQPTLHKPGIMAHTARILKNQKTLRLHYANCSTYNADFDGDEMNIHFPQDFYGRAEAYRIMHADQQYIVPTDGKPIRGLIQDHICSAVLLMNKDTFFDREKFMQLIYNACSGISSGSRPGAATSEDPTIKISEPAIYKPKQLWTGKQVLSCLLRHVIPGSPLTHSAGGKVPGSYWGSGSSEETVLRIHRNEVVHGVLDKAQFGKYGLVHAVHELYGATVAGRLLSAFSRLFTYYLQMHGFSCSIEDLFLKPEAEEARQYKLKAANEASLAAASKFSGCDSDETGVRSRVMMRLRNRPGDEAALDAHSTNALHPIASDVVKACLPTGQKLPFPLNGMSLMTASGAKGSGVNFSQISCLLGQQELEGRRVPRMSSGKTLPSFRPFELAARAGGFIGDRFLSGLRPQEYYFHCMAGREGLVDTAVKTSRSGYLQRCLIKGLESLRIHYDNSVRDSDGSIVQFRYGEDGLDVTKRSFLDQFEFFAMNEDATREDPLTVEASLCLNERDLKLVSEKFEKDLTSFMKKVETEGSIKLKMPLEEFGRLMRMRFVQALAAPGEAAGVVAGQSLGEPSTQMTLNTFHQAGRGEANVTLGIPRLREILMTASKNIATPIMTLPIREHLGLDGANEVMRCLQRVTLAEILAGIHVRESVVGEASRHMLREYTITLRFHPESSYQSQLPSSISAIMNDIVKGTFVAKIEKAAAAELKKFNGKEDSMAPVRFEHGQPEEGEVNGEGPDDSSDSDSDSDASSADLDRAQKQDARSGEKEEKDEMQKNPGKDLSDLDEDGSSSADDENSSSDDDDVNMDPKESEKITTDKPKAARGVSGAGREKKRRRPAKKGKNKSKEEKGGPAVKIMEEACQFAIYFNLECPRLLILELTERVAKDTIVKSTPHINKCFIIGGEGTGKDLAVQTDGVNIAAAQNLSHIVDVANIQTNDINAMLESYGVESAYNTIINEVRGVFGVYGIKVDPRHLNLIADHMTFEGECRPFTRSGLIDASVSPLQRMSFETAVNFLTKATLYGDEDNLQSPSARLCVGKVVDLGTGTFNLLQNISL